MLICFFLSDYKNHNRQQVLVHPLCQMLPHKLSIISPQIGQLFEATNPHATGLPLVVSHKRPSVLLQQLSFVGCYLTEPVDKPTEEQV